MTAAPLSADTQATALLVGRFGKGTTKPLTRTDFNRVAQTLHQCGLRPSDLFRQVPENLPVDGERISGLISRGTALALAIESWSQVGVRVVGRAEESYPARFRALLRGGAAPILYYAGDLALFERATVSVVGSRDATQAGLRFAKGIGERAAEERIVTVSGDARGVDRAAMEAALDNGGQVIGVLADSLAKSVLSKRYRQAITGGQLLLVSHVEPDARFTVAQAMERNRYIYAAGDAVIIADSDVKGGTWSGAIENMKHRWAPAFVRVGREARQGNVALAREGLNELDDDWLNTSNSLRSLFGVSTETAGGLPLFTPAAPSRTDRLLPHSTLERDLLYRMFRDRLLATLDTSSDETRIADHFGLEPRQALVWLHRAADEGEIQMVADGQWQRRNFQSP